MAAGLAIITYASLSGVDAWNEYFQYFGGSKFVSISILVTSYELMKIHPTPPPPLKENEEEREEISLWRFF